MHRKNVKNLVLILTIKQKVSQKFQLNHHHSNIDKIPPKTSPEVLIIQQQHSAIPPSVVEIQQLQQLSQSQTSQHNSLKNSEQHLKHSSVHP